MGIFGGGGGGGGDGGDRVGMWHLEFRSLGFVSGHLIPLYLT